MTDQELQLLSDKYKPSDFAIIRYNRNRKY